MSAPPRSPHGSRVPGWYEPADLTKPEAGVPTLAEVEVPAELRAEIEAYVSRYPDRRSAILPALKAAQRHHGWCSPLAIEQVAAVLGVTPAELQAVATFYDMLETEPKPRRRHDIYVCTNISCSLRGADRLYQALLEAAEGREELNVRSFECLGACELAPMVSVDGNYIGPLQEGQAAELIDRLLAGEEPFPELSLARRPCADPAAREEAGELSKPPKLLLAGIDREGLATLAGYKARGGYESLAKARSMAPEEVLAELEASGLRGRGGAGAGHLQGQGTDPEVPPHVERGDCHRLPRRRDRAGLHLHPRRVPAPGRCPRAGPGGSKGGGAGRRPWLGGQALDRPPPRRRRLHLRRGDRPPGLPGGQAGQPPPEAPLPRRQGPLPGADADQQRRDPCHGAGDHQAGRQAVRLAGHRDLNRHEDRLGLRPRSATRQLRDRARHPGPGDHLRSCRRPAGGKEGEVLVPGRLLRTGAHRGGA